MKVSSIVAALLCTSAANVNAFSIQSNVVVGRNAIITSRCAESTGTTSALQMSSEESSSPSSPFDFLSGLFPKNDNASSVIKEEVKPKLPDVVIDPNYNIAIAFGAIGVFIEFIALQAGSGYAVIQGGITLLFAVFLAIQASRIRFVFDEDSFELKMGGDDLESSGENIVVGGENKWKYTSFINYDFFPNKGLPILVYFKENQTPEDKWSEGPGGLDKVGGGQLHFFPAIANTDQLKEQFALRGCAKKD